SLSAVPPGVNWDRLAEEMTGNIRVGLAAGECVGDFPVRRRPPLLHWNVAASVGMLALLFIAAFLINLPAPQSRRIADTFRRLVGAQTSAPIASISSLPGAVLEASPRQIEPRSNGTALSVVPANPSDVTVSVSLQGSASARVVDGDTGQVTISRVYYAQ